MISTGSAADRGRRGDVGPLHRLRRLRRRRQLRRHHGREHGAAVPHRHAQAGHPPRRAAHDRRADRRRDDACCRPRPPAARPVKLPAIARPSSPFFGTFTLVVSGYLFSSLIYFYPRRPRRRRAMARTGPRRRWPVVPAVGVRLSATTTSSERPPRTGRASGLALTILPLLIIAHSTLGFIFGIQAGGRAGSARCRRRRSSSSPASRAPAC